LYVKDVVAAIMLSLANKKAKGLYNISGVASRWLNKSVSLEEEAQAIIGAFSPRGRKQSKIVYNSCIPNSVEEFCYEIIKARKDLQWMPQYDLIAMMQDIKEEMKSERFRFLLEKRKIQLEKESAK
jgi:nucleoside-diphosphate-sugar epimerase